LALVRARDGSFCSHSPLARSWVGVRGGAPQPGGNLIGKGEVPLQRKSSDLEEVREAGWLLLIFSAYVMRSPQGRPLRPPAANSPSRGSPSPSLSCKYFGREQPAVADAGWCMSTVGPGTANLGSGTYGPPCAFQVRLLPLRRLSQGEACPATTHCSNVGSGPAA